ncbi:MAG: hypothetical protein GXP25_05580 [Planctomycetes bacterium]|nr:hypothetical protein [Planctomycetota bacterium]
MTRTRFAIVVAVVMSQIPSLHAAGKRYPYIEKYTVKLQKLKMPLKEAMNKVMEQYGGIPIGGSLELGEEDGSFIYCVQTVRPAQDGKPASIWEVVLDAETGEMVNMENATRGKERELRRREEEQRRERERDGEKQEKQKQPVAEGKYPYVQRYIAQIQKVGVPIQEAMSSVIEEHGGIPIAAAIEPGDEEEGGFLVTVTTLKPGKDGKPTRIWEIGIDAATGELMRISNAARWIERDLKEREADRERERKEREQERKNEKEDDR